MPAAILTNYRNKIDLPCLIEYPLLSSGFFPGLFFVFNSFISLAAIYFFTNFIHCKPR
jgi:hypothetical protein